MKKVLTAVAVAFLICVASSVSWGAETESATWESATWESATWESATWESATWETFGSFDVVWE